MNKLEYAQMFLKNKISVIPLRHRGKEPENTMIKSWEPYKTKLPTEYQVNNWFASTWQNYGVVTGWQSLCVLDFDQWKAYELWRDWFALLNKHIEVYPMPYIVKSSRGAHVYLSAPNGRSNEKRLGVDVKFHGYVVGPGSIHPSGEVYEALTQYRLIDVFSLSTILPDELFPRVVPVAPVAPVGQIAPVQMVLQTNTEYDPFVIASNSSDVDLITKVKQSVRIEMLFSSVHKTSADGRWLSCLCPFHNDKNPSAWIDTRRQLFGCNSCNMKPMDAINLYARLHNISDAVAVSALAQEVGVWA